ncbi:MAG TPA: phage terminase large subunit [Polyangiaceae bacterium]
MYRPTVRGAEFHDLAIPNAILEGPRGTGKSIILRNDAHIHALKWPGMAYLIVRRMMPELRRSHLRFIEREMVKLGGTFNKTESIAYYANGSRGYYGHCETDADVLIYLGSEFARLYIDEITTFPGDMILKLGSTIRVPEGSGWIAALRGGTNPLGESADFVQRWFITKEVPEEESDEYDASEYTALKMVPEDNPFMDWAQYRRRLKNLPEHVRRAWLAGEWVIEGVYFNDFKQRRNGAPWHVLDEPPTHKNETVSELNQPHGVAMYRCLDFGFDPDPAVCLWVAVLPSGRCVVVKERTWYQTTAVEVGRAVKRESEGMRITETFADPSMFDNQKATGTSVADLIEQQGIALTPSVNDRIAAGYAIHELLNTEIAGTPKLQFLRYGCPQLIRTLPEIRQDKNNPQKIAHGNDHYVMALSYFAMGNAVPSLEVVESVRKPWMRAYHQGFRIGADNVREGAYP